MNERKPVRVSEETKQTGEARSKEWYWVERSVWTERMLEALEKGVKGGVWFSLIDKVYRPTTLYAGWLKVKARKGKIIAIVNEGLTIKRHLAADVAEVHVGQPALAAVLPDGFVNVALGHLGKRSQTEFERIGGAGRDVEQPLVELRLINQPRLAA